MKTRIWNRYDIDRWALTIWSPVREDPRQPFTTPEGLSLLFNVHINTVYAWLRSGAISCHKLGNTYGIYIDSLRNFCAKHRPDLFPLLPPDEELKQEIDGITRIPLDGPWDGAVIYPQSEKPPKARLRIHLKIHGAFRARNGRHYLRTSKKGVTPIPFARPAYIRDIELVRAIESRHTRSPDRVFYDFEIGRLTNATSLERVPRHAELRIF